MSEDPRIAQLKEMIEGQIPGMLVYQGFSRHFCPYLLGITGDRRVVLHAYQYGGMSSKGEVAPDKGAGWRFFYLDTVDGPIVKMTMPASWYPADLEKSEADYTPPKFIVAVLALFPGA